MDRIGSEFSPHAPSLRSLTAARKPSSVSSELACLLDAYLAMCSGHDGRFPHNGCGSEMASEGISIAEKGAAASTDSVCGYAQALSSVTGSANTVPEHSTLAEEAIVRLLAGSARAPRPSATARRDSKAKSPTASGKHSVGFAASTGRAATPSERLLRLFREVGTSVYLPAQRKHRVDYSLGLLPGMPAGHSPVGSAAQSDPSIPAGIDVSVLRALQHRRPPPHTPQSLGYGQPSVRIQLAASRLVLSRSLHAIDALPRWLQWLWHDAESALGEGGMRLFPLGLGDASRGNMRALPLSVDELASAFSHHASSLVTALREQWHEPASALAADWVRGLEAAQDQLASASTSSFSVDGASPLPHSAGQSLPGGAATGTAGPVVPHRRSSWAASSGALTGTFSAPYEPTPRYDHTTHQQRRRRASTGQAPVAGAASALPSSGSGSVRAALTASATAALDPSRRDLLDSVRRLHQAVGDVRASLQLQADSDEACVSELRACVEALQASLPESATVPTRQLLNYTLGTARGALEGGADVVTPCEAVGSLQRALRLGDRRGHALVARLRGVLAACAAVMSESLRCLVFRSLGDLAHVLRMYQQPAVAPRRPVPAMPAVVQIVLSLRFGQGGVLPTLSADGAPPPGAGSDGDGGSGSPGDGLRGLWAGEAWVGAPSLPDIATRLHGAVTGCVSLCGSLPRVECQLASANSLSQVDAMAAAANRKRAAAAGSAADGAGAGTATAAVMEMAAGPSAAVIPCVALDDHAVAAVRDQLSALLAAAAPAVEEVSARFRRFMRLFSEAERQRWIDAVGDAHAAPRDRTRQGPGDEDEEGAPGGARRGLRDRSGPMLRRYTAVLREVDDVVASIASAAPPETFAGFVSLDCEALKQALIARTRLLATSALKSLRAHALAECARLNVAHSDLSRRLLQLPLGLGEYLAARSLHESEAPGLLLDWERSLRGPDGVVPSISFLYGEGTPREFQRHELSAGPASGPPGFFDPARYACAPQPGFSASGLAGDGEGLALARPQLAVLKEALGWTERVRGDVAACGEALAAARGRLVDGAASREAALRTALEEARREGRHLQNESSALRAEGMAAAGEALVAALGSLREDCGSLGAEQALLGLPTSASDLAAAAEATLAEAQPYADLWALVREISAATTAWLAAPVRSLAGVDMLGKLQHMQSRLAALRPSVHASATQHNRRGSRAGSIGDDYAAHFAAAAATAAAAANAPIGTAASGQASDGTTYPTGLPSHEPHPLALHLERHLTDLAETDLLVLSLLSDERFTAEGALALSTAAGLDSDATGHIDPLNSLAVGVSSFLDSVGLNSTCRQDGFADDSASEGGHSGGGGDGDSIAAILDAFPRLREPTGRLAVQRAFAAISGGI